jgi:hypothetical protein
MVYCGERGHMSFHIGVVCHVDFDESCWHFFATGSWDAEGNILSSNVLFITLCPSLAGQVQVSCIDVRAGNGQRVLPGRGTDGGGPCNTWSGSVTSALTSASTSSSMYTHPLGSFFLDGVGRQYFSGILTILLECSGESSCQHLGLHTIEVKCCHSVGWNGWSWDRYGCWSTGTGSVGWSVSECL